MKSDAYNLNLNPPEYMNFDGQALRCRSLEDGLVELTFDLQGESINKFNRATTEELREVVSLLQQQSNIRGLLITSAKEVFIVGADITEFMANFKVSQEKIAAGVREAQQIFLDLENLEFPSVCAINGYALGGGFELCLACTYRVVSTRAKVGQPEVKLGILPGFGGTTRLPRLIGVDNALEWMALGNEQSADAALKSGAVDAVSEPDTLRESALTLLRRAVAGELDWQAKREDLRGPLKLNENEALMAFESARGLIAQKAGKNYPAPLTIVGVVQASAPLPLEQALEIEAEGFAELAKTPQAAALVGIFLGDQLLKKKAKQARKQARPFEQAAVLGAGIMGGGIAYQSAYKGIPIVMKDIAQSQLDLGLNEASKILTKRIERGRLTPDKMAATLTRILPTLSYDALRDADIVIEAVVEREDVKRLVYGELQTMVREDAVIASNTSTISINRLAESIQNPERFCGMHFFNPVHRMPLVEVIRGKDSSVETIATTVAYASAMGKSPVVVNDCPGFLVNRILFPYFAGFNGLLKDGVDFQRIDKVMEKFGWPMGPAFLLDVVGIDTSRHAEHVMAAGFPDRMAPSSATITDLFYDNNRYGQKNDTGFYLHTTDARGRRKKVRDPEADALLQTWSQPVDREVSDDEIVDRMMLPMLMESSRCLEDGIVESPAEVDMSLVYGVGFPPFRGGIFRWVDQVGAATLVGKGEKYASLLSLNQPTAQLRELANRNDKFYPL